MKTGKCYISSAGHPKPIIKLKGGPTYKAELRRGMAMGFMENAVYKATPITLEPGMRMLLYTDGLTEATNASGEEIGDKRIIDYLNTCETPTTKDFVHQALSCVAKFTGCTNQSDDICMLGIAYNEIDSH